MPKKPFYITTTIPYVNAEPHLGHAMEFIRADVVVRYKKMLGYEVFFNTGTDEHGIKVFKKASEMKVDPQKYVDEYAAIFKGIYPILGLSEDLNFIRTTDSHHIMAAQEFWKKCLSGGYIYKKNYKTKYCVGCELEKMDSELNDDGKCPLHPNLQIELIDEENYFFKFSAFQKPLLDFYSTNPDFVQPEFRFNEIRSFVSRGLEDFSISRMKSKMPWGIEVPGDSSQVMYVWFDALVNYISAIGWPDDLAKFDKWSRESGGMVQYCGKDNLRQQSAMWQSMLMAAGLPNSQKIIINGFITGAGGVKMSKSLGNVVYPAEIVQEYSTDALRYFVCRELSPFEDSPFTKERFKDSYNAALANGIGNLTSRMMKMASQFGIKADLAQDEEIKASKEWMEYTEAFDRFDLQSASNVIWKIISDADAYIQKTQPFKLVKTAPEEAKEHLIHLIKELYKISFLLTPFMPETARIVSECALKGISPEKPLFMRK